MAKFIETLDALMGRILDLDARKLDVIADTTQMNAYVNGGDKVRLYEQGTETYFALNEHMRSQIATDLSIPKRYFDRMVSDAPRLAVTNINHWLQEEPNRRMIRAYREPEGGAPDLPVAVGRAWLSPGYRRLDHVEIAKTLLPEFEQLGFPVEFHQAAVSDTKLYVRALFPTIEREIKAGDVIRWGVEITNSEVGSGSLGIRGFILRLICTNGMTAAYTLKKRHVGKRIDEDGILSDDALRADDTAFWLAARDTLRATIQETRFEEIVTQLRETTEGPEIERVVEAAQVMQKTLGFSDEERDQVLTHLAGGGDLSRWGALNAVTRAAQSSPTIDRQVEMEGIGWEIANFTPKEWEKIAVAVAS